MPGWVAHRVMDHECGGQPSPGVEALREIKRERPQQPVFMVTAVAEVATAVESMRLGAHDHVLKPFALHDMLR